LLVTSPFGRGRGSAAGEGDALFNVKQVGNVTDPLPAATASDLSQREREQTRGTVGRPPTTKRFLH